MWSSTLTTTNTSPRELAARVAALTAELAAAVDMLRQALEEPTDPDRALLELLVLRTAGATFTAGSLLELAAIDPVLRAALEAWPTARALGCRLRELSSYDRGVFRLEAAGRDKSGMIWEARSM